MCINLNVVEIMIISDQESGPRTPINDLFTGYFILLFTPSFQL